MKSLALVHLVRRANGVAPFKLFMTSYRAYAPGADAELVLLAKGFGGSRLPNDYSELAGGQAARTIMVPEGGYDLGSYRFANDILQTEYVCFVNSFSVVRQDGWLELLYRAIRRPSIGIAGATGSYESRSSWLQATFRREVTLAGSERTPRAAVRASFALAEARRGFAKFPNPHVRSNAFIMEGLWVSRVMPSRLRTKRDAEIAESGRSGITRRLSSCGLGALVVGRDGVDYAMQAWPDSGTFRRGGQENLLVEDNRTREYEAADPTERRLLERMAWGPYRQ
jgi:hypothetical protein